jgi:hypothetical protein
MSGSDVARRRVLTIIRGLASEGSVVFGEHAFTESMGDDGVFPADVLHVLENATECLAQDDDRLKFKVYGPIIDGSDYAVVVNVSDDHLFVVTCHLPP